MTNATRRIAALTAAAALTVALSSACSSENADVSCNLNECTATFNRGVDAKASVLGIEVKLVNVDNGTVTLDVEGNQVKVPVDGEAEAEGLDIEVQEVTKDKVVLRISRGT
jgi:hypothetical protein